MHFYEIIPSWKAPWLGGEAALPHVGALVTGLPRMFKKTEQMNYENLP